MAASIGESLREARTEQGIELSEVERATKIRVKFLLAMEQDQWQDLPAPAYARGFLFSYARFLGLDEQKLVDRYKQTIEGQGPAGTIPTTVIRPGSLAHARSRRPYALVGGGIAAILLLGVIVAGSLGGSDGDGGDDRASQTQERADENDGQASEPARTAPATTTASDVSLELRAEGLVWVCVVDEREEPVVNSETLTDGETRGPFSSTEFDLNLGNGSVAINVDGEAVDVPSLAEPIGYRVTPEGVRELAPSARPTCA